MTDEPSRRALVTPFRFRRPVVILGAGRGRRLGAAADGTPKPLLAVGPRSAAGTRLTLLELAAAACEPFSSTLHVVMATDGPALREVVARLPRPVRVHVQPEPAGTLTALQRIASALPDRFVVMLGDCAFRGTLEGPADAPVAVGVWAEGNADAVRTNYGVILRAGRVAALHEKPRAPGDMSCGTGFYLLDQRFLAATRSVPADPEGRCELTEALAHYLAAGGTIEALTLSGTYVNVNTVGDLERARACFEAP